MVQDGHVAASQSKDRIKIYHYVRAGERVYKSNTKSCDDSIHLANNTDAPEINHIVDYAITEERIAHQAKPDLGLQS